MPSAEVSAAGRSIVLDLVSAKRTITQTQDFMKGPDPHEEPDKNLGPARRFSGNPAFTLIELLVVIPIIPILAALQRWNNDHQPHPEAIWSPLRRMRTQFTRAASINRRRGKKVHSYEPNLY